VCPGNICSLLSYAARFNKAPRVANMPCICDCTVRIHSLELCLANPCAGGQHSVLLSLLQACRPDLVPAAVHHYVSATLGPSFADPPAAKLSHIFADSSAATPLILTVAQGADAMAELGAFAAAQGRGVGRGLLLLSLGQGQGPVAEATVRLAMRNGDWVCLQVRVGVLLDGGVFD
jgi:hypothetical protein